MLVADVFVTEIASPDAPECAPPRHTPNHLEMWNRGCQPLSPDMTDSAALSCTEKPNRRAWTNRIDSGATLRSMGSVISTHRANSMKKLWTFFGVFLVSLTLALTAADANAAKFGGKRSFGKSYRTAPAPQAQPVNTAKPGVNQPAAGAAKKGMLGGLMGGLLAGGLLAWMFGSGAFEGLQIMDMLIMAGVAFLAFKLFRSMSQAKNGAMARQPAAAYSPAGSVPPTPSPAFNRDADSAAPQASTGFNNDVPFNLPAGFDLQQFLNGARDHYRTLQEAWNRNDFSKIQEYVTPELYNGLVEERKNYAGEQHTDVMFVDAELVRAEHNPNLAQISVQFKGRYRDAVEGIEEDIAEVWHLERDLRTANAPWLIVGIEQ